MRAGRLINFIWTLGLTIFFGILCFRPTAFDHFLYRYGFALLLLEFLTIHCTILFLHFVSHGPIKARVGIGVFFFLFYSAFLWFAAVLASSKLVILYFWLSMGFKLIAHLSNPESERRKSMAGWWRMVILFLVSLFVSVGLYKLVLWIAGSFGLTGLEMSWEELGALAGGPQHEFSGDMPLTFIPWFMVVYFGFQAACELLPLIRRKKAPSRQTSAQSKP